MDGRMYNSLLVTGLLKQKTVGAIMVWGEDDKTIIVGLTRLAKHIRQMKEEADQ